MSSVIRKNIVSGSACDDTTVYTATNTNKLFTTPFSNNATWAVQVEWSGLSATDSTITIQGAYTENGSYDDLPNSSTKVLDSADGSHTFTKDDFAYEYMGVNYIANSETTGQIKITLTIKPCNNGNFC